MKRLLMAGLALASLTGVSYAADMPVKARPPVAVAVDSWSGFYIGGNVGYSWGRANTDQRDVVGTSSITECFRAADLSPITGPTSIQLCNIPPAANVFPVVTPLAVTTTGTSASGDIDGFVGGGQIGYNWKRDQWLFGLEADIQYSDQKGSYTACSVAGCVAGSAIGAADHRLRWFGTFRGRVGWLPTDWLLLYATGGLVYGELESNYLSGIVGTTVLAGGSSTTRAGWTVGGGAEGRINNQWSVKLEYLYADYGNFDTSLGTGAAVVTVGPCTAVGSTPAICTRTTTTSTVSSTASTNFIDHVIRVGLNYRFGGPRL